MGERTFRILYTSDIHGRLFARPGEAGLDAAGREFDKDGNTLILTAGTCFRVGPPVLFLCGNSGKRNGSWSKSPGANRIRCTRRRR